MKMNWGTGILITCAVFMTATTIMGIKLMNTEVELVADNYYDKEIKYQGQIDIMKNTLEHNAAIDITAANSYVKLLFPQALARDAKGTIRFYRPASGKKDFTMDVNPGSGSTQMISTSGLAKGFWKISISWTSGGNEFYTETPIMVD